jgi:hypothetical protein
MAQQFISFAQNPEFRPLPAIDNAGKAAAAAKKELAQLKQYFDSRRVVDQQAIEDARFSGQNIKALASLTESGTKYFEALTKQTELDKRVGEQWEAYTNGIDPETAAAETQYEALAQGENEAIANARVGQDSITTQQLEDLRQIGRGYQGQRASLIDGRNKYAAYLTNFVASDQYVTYNGKLYKAFDLLSEGGTNYDQKLEAALAQGRLNFIKENGYQNATKTAFVSILGPTIDAVENNLRLNKTTAAIASKQKDELARIDALTKDSVSRVKGPVSLAELQGVFNQSTNDYRINNTGLTRREGNARAVEILTRTLIENDVPGNIEKLKLVQQIPGQEGTELGRLYGPEIQKAIVEASKDEKEADGIAADRIEEELYDSLEQETTVEGRAAKIAAAVKELEGLRSITGDRRAQALRGDSPTLILDPDSKINDAVLKQKVAQGDYPDFTATTNAYQAGRYSKQAYDDYVKGYSQVAKSKDPIVKETFDGYQEGLDRQVETKLGLKKDPTGKFNLVGKPLPYVDYATSSALVTAINRDLVIERNRLLRNTTETDPVKLAQIVDAGLDKWEKANFRTVGGKYYLDGFWDATLQEVTDAKTAETRFKKHFDKFKDPTFRNAPSSLPKKLSSNYDPTKPISVDVALDYSPSRGDMLFDDTQVASYKAAWDAGMLDPELVNASESVNMSPLDLMNYELAAHQQAPYKPKVDAASISGAKQGTHAFELAGFPPRSAGYLSAAVSSMTDWSDPEGLDLEQWAEQMRLLNPRAYRLLMSPNSSNRHMQYALTELIGPDIPDLSALAQYLSA